jgi:hypothetical protein
MGALVLKQHVRIKYKTFIYTVVGRASVKETAVYKKYVALLSAVFSAIDENFKNSFKNPYNLIFNMPMEAHGIPWMLAGDMIQLYRKVNGAMFSQFLIFIISHNILLSINNHI